MFHVSLSFSSSPPSPLFILERGIEKKYISPYLCSFQSPIVLCAINSPTLLSLLPKPLGSLYKARFCVCRMSERAMLHFFWFLRNARPSPTYGPSYTLLLMSIKLLFTWLTFIHSHVSA